MISLKVKVAILGGGFGLYGYLPALSKIKNVRVILLNRYRERIYTRTDIKPIFKSIEWVNDHETLLELCEALIIALPPEQQFLWVKKCLKYSNINYILLEKPLAITPDLAIDLILDLQTSGKKFRIGYNFRYTDWGVALLNSLSSIESISWNFQAYHYAKNIQNWKRQHKNGGGALRFYGIHLIALLSELGYNNTAYSEIKTNHKNEAETWSAEIIGDNLNNCTLNIATNSAETNFIIIDSNGYTYSLLHPFQAISSDAEDKYDQRVPFLIKGLLDLFEHSELYYGWYIHTNTLWKNIEQWTLL